MEELRERIYIDMEEWWSISKYESNTVIAIKNQLLKRELSSKLQVESKENLRLYSE
ncbi:hypothetical protein M069_5812 [Bacteroides fragilis str. B1 (UDC16-1)]|nr:hypothetical protein M069_5812 [Bacteroides fragilis str. B1 (UDC16-1)]